MLIQRRGDHYTEHTLYDGDKTVGLEPYFREATKLADSIVRYHLAPGASEGMHLHDDSAESCTPHSSDELYLVVSGELVMTVDDESTVLGPGDAAYAPAGSLHGITNESDAPAELILLFGSPVDSPATH